MYTGLPRRHDGPVNQYYVCSNRRLVTVGRPSVGWPRTTSPGSSACRLSTWTFCPCWDSLARQGRQRPPTALVVAALWVAVLIRYLVQRHKLHQSHKNATILPIEVRAATERLFDMIDREGRGKLGVQQVQEMLSYMNASSTETRTESQVREFMQKVFGTENTVRRSQVLQAAMNGKIDAEGSEARSWIERQQLDQMRGSYVSVFVQICLLFHPPLSQKVFYYFNVVNLNGRKFLRET